MIKSSFFIFIGLVLFSSVTLMIFPDLKGKGLNQWQENTIRLENYAYSSEHYRCVIAGSSLSSRIQSELLAPNDYNLSVSGGDALTGLEIVIRSGNLPKCLLIEVNATLLRGADPETIEKLFNPTFYALKKHFPVLRQSYQPVNILGSWLKQHFTSGRKADNRAVNFAEHLEAQVAIENMPLEPAKIEQALANLKRNIQELTKLGVQIYFFDLPRDQQLEKSLLNSEIKTQVTRQIEAVKWIRPKIDTSLTTEDGQHLVFSSASIFTKALAEQIKDL